jgi:hypothetical protein
MEYIPVAGSYVVALYGGGLLVYGGEMVNAVFGPQQGGGRYSQSSFLRKKVGSAVGFG